MKKRKTNKAKRVDKTCRNNGSCLHCRANRLNQVNRQILKTDGQINECL